MQHHERVAGHADCQAEAANAEELVLQKLQSATSL